MLSVWDKKLAARDNSKHEQKNILHPLLFHALVRIMIRDKLFHALYQFFTQLLNKWLRLEAKRDAFASPQAEQHAELWYPSGRLLVYSPGIEQV